MHGIPTWSVAPRGTPSGDVDGGCAEAAVSDAEVVREIASVDSLRRVATRMLAEEAEASLPATPRDVDLEADRGTGSVIASSFPFPLTLPVDITAVSRETEAAFALGESPGFPATGFLGAILFRVEGEVEAVDRSDAFEGNFCAGLVLSLTESGSGGTAFFDFDIVFVLVIEVADVRLGLLVAGAVIDVVVAVVFTLTVETVDETELRRGRGVSSPGNSELVLLNVDDASLR
jgi:hypothetical protein